MIKEEILDDSGNVVFHVTEESGRNYLYHGSEKIAECIYANYQEKFKDINGWLKSVLKRENNRLDTIAHTIVGLQQERARRTSLTEDIYNYVQSKRSS